MQIANCLLILNEYGSCVPKQNITPAEAQFLVWSHQENARQLPIKDLQILDLKEVSSDELDSLDGALDSADVDGQAKRADILARQAYNEKIIEADKRTSAQEKQRLKEFYKPHSQDAKAMTIEKVWPGANAQLPKDFVDVVDAEGRQVFDNDGSITAEAANTTSIEIDGVKYSAAQVKEALANKGK